MEEFYVALLKPTEQYLVIIQYLEKRMKKRKICGFIQSPSVTFVE